MKAVLKTKLTKENMKDRAAFIAREREWDCRKMTPREYWRVMGFADTDHNKAAQVVSKTHLYQQAGNSIVRDVMVELLDVVARDFPKDKPLNLIELFAGIGSPRIALRDLGYAVNPLLTVEVDEKAVKSYNKIFDDAVVPKDIKDVVSIPAGADLLVYGFPCQDISIMGKKQGFEHGSETRSSLVHEVLRLLKTAKENNSLPRMLIAENVKALLDKRFKPGLDGLLATLSELGYANSIYKMDAQDFGIPQSRKRVFIVSVMPEMSHILLEQPEKKELKPLKGMMEPEVEDSYWYSTKFIAERSNLGRIQAVWYDYGEDGKVKMLSEPFYVTDEMLKLYNETGKFE